MSDLVKYQGRWVALTEEERVVAVGDDPAEARRFAEVAHPASRLTVAWVSPHEPYVPLPAWPLQDIRTVLAGEDVWLAGGPVRDLLMGELPHDWDFATAGSGLALARRVADALDGAYYALDRERGTGRAVVMEPGTEAPITIDFAELRGDDLVEDLRARDFTINAMAMTLEGELIDPTGGQQDLANRRLTMTHPRSFQDDPVRLLRAVRFAVRLSLTIEAETRNHIVTEAPSIEHAAAERAREELTRLFANGGASAGLVLLTDLGLVDYLLPEIGHLRSVPLPETGPYAHALAQTLALVATTELLLNALPRDTIADPTTDHAAPGWAWRELLKMLCPLQDGLVRHLSVVLSAGVRRKDLLTWAAAFYLAGAATDVPQNHAPQADGTTTTLIAQPATSAALAERRLRALRFSNKAVEYVTRVVSERMRFAQFVENRSANERDAQERRAIYRFYRETKESGIAIVLLALAWVLATKAEELDPDWWREQLEAAGELLDAYLNARAEVVSPTPILSGRELMALGVPEGPAIGELLEELREAQAAGEVETLDEARDYVAARAADR
ncbi:MAG: DUF5678 domain-containing protein [Anaerolineae bacterium]